MTSFFPDVNVWIALSYGGHQHHAAAVSWFDGLNGEAVCFCRFTQLSFLRLLTHPGVMGDDLRSQAKAWEAYDLLLSDERVSFYPEPDPQPLESIFRKLTAGTHPSSKQWPDAHLSAFAQAADLVLVTFDRALQQITHPNSLLLR